MQTKGVTMRGPATTETREPEILANLQCLEKQIAVLSEASSNLINRISIICREETSINKELPPQEPESSCELAMQLNRLADDIQNIRKRLEYQLTVIEL